MRRVGDRSGQGGGPVLIIVQNLPVPFDRRVWLECQALARRVPGRGRVPEGAGDPGVPAPRRGRALQVPALPPGGSRRLRRRVRVLVPHDGEAGAHGRAGAALRGHPGVQPARHLLAASAAVLRAPRRIAVRLRPARPVPRALRVAVPRRGRACRTGSCWRWSGRPSAPPATSSRPTSPTAGRPSAAARSTPTTSRSSAPAPTPIASGVARAVPEPSGAAASSPRTSA